jgi:hypothetical protein
MGDVNDVEMIAEQMEAIAGRLERYASNLRAQTEFVRKTHRIEEAESVLNELMWLTPNLGIQALVSRYVRAIQRGK